MLTCFNVQKIYYFSNTVHYCSSSLPRISQTLRFLQSPSIRQVLSALIGTTDWRCDWLNTSSTCRKCNCPHHNHELQLPSWFYQSKSKRGTESCDKHSDARMYLQYTSRSEDDFWRAVHSAVMWPCSPLTHTHSRMTRYTQNSTFERSIANTWTNNKTYSGWFRSARLSQ